MACCACGGGSTSGYCRDSPSGWYDSGGPVFNCDWYAFGIPGENSCEKDGDSYADENGITANIACCTCGGGSRTAAQYFGGMNLVEFISHILLKKMILGFHASSNFSGKKWLRQQN